MSVFSKEETDKAKALAFQYDMTMYEAFDLVMKVNNQNILSDCNECLHYINENVRDMSCDFEKIRETLEIKL